MLLIGIVAGVALWMGSGIISANKAEKAGLLHPVPEIGGIGYCAYVIMGPFGLLKRRNS